MDLVAVILFPDKINKKIEKLRKNISENFGPKEALNWPPHLTLIGFKIPDKEKVKFFYEFQKFAKKIKQSKIYLKGFKLYDDFPTSPYVKSPYVVAISVKKTKELLEFYNTISKFKKYRTDGKKSFNPHITLAYNDTNKENFQKIKKYLKNKELNEIANIKEITLIINKNNKHIIYKKLPLNL